MHTGTYRYYDLRVNLCEIYKMDASRERKVKIEKKMQKNINNIF